MQLRINTEKLKEMVLRAVKGASQNKLIPLTSLMLIEVKNNTLTLETTDYSNYLYIKHDLVADDFYAVVQVEQFSKLISKLTCENVTLEVEETTLTIKGNGTYKIELPVDENGSAIQYPNPIAKATLDTEPESVNLTTIKSILDTNRAALAVTMESPVYMNYYVGDTVVSTDMSKICSLNVKVFDEPLLITSETMDLLGLMTEEKISVFKASDDVIIFKTKDCELYSVVAENIEDFDIDAINTFVNETFESSCKVNKNDLLSVLDRISLFVGTYDEHAINLNFTSDGLAISSIQSTGIEKLAYIDSKNFKDYICPVDIELLTQQVKANTADTIEIEYGNDRSIKLINDNITQIVALMVAENE